MRKTKIRLIAFLSTLVMIFSFVACNKGDGGSSTGGNYPTDAYMSILSDRKFKKGFKVRGLGIPIYPEHADEETFGDPYETGVVFQYGQEMEDEPVWDVCQWSSRYAFHDPSVTTFTADGTTYTYQNKSKLLRVDTSTGKFTLGLEGEECYVYGDRVVGQEWPHLLISRDIKKSQLTKLSDKKEVRVVFDATLDKYEDKMTVEPHVGIHAASLMFYLYVANFDEETNNFNDMLWLGMQVFDSREAFMPEFAKGDVDSKASETGKYIYNVDTKTFLTKNNNFWKNGKISVGSSASVDFDILPFVKVALEKAQADGYMTNAEFENLYVNGMYIGFELPGTYNLQMTIENMDVKVI